MTLLRALIGVPFAVIFVALTPLIIVVNLLIPRQRYLRIQADGALSEIEGRLSQLDGHIHAGDSVLDVGCGAGRFGDAIAKRFSAKVAGVDVVDYVDAPIPVQIYDGDEIPFADDSFDVVVLAFMLHHVQDQDKLLKEAVRVSRDRVIVFEDAYHYGWQKPFVVWNDYYANLILGTIKVYRGAEGKGILSIPMPLTFRSVRGWADYFKQFQLDERQTLLRHSLHKPHTKVTFVLAKG